MKKVELKAIRESVAGEMSDFSKTVADLSWAPESKGSLKRTGLKRTVCEDLWKHTEQLEKGLTYVKDAFYEMEVAGKQLSKMEEKLDDKLRHLVVSEKVCERTPNWGGGLTPGHSQHEGAPQAEARKWYRAEVTLKRALRAFIDLNG